MSVSGTSDESIRASLAARCDLIENFGEGLGQAAQDNLRSALRRLPADASADLRMRLEELGRSRVGGAQAPAALELATLSQEECELGRGPRRPERETFYPCDLDTPVRCPHCRRDTQHPLCVLESSVLCPSCNGHFEIRTAP